MQFVALPRFAGFGGIYNLWQRILCAFRDDFNFNFELFFSCVTLLHVCVCTVCCSGIPADRTTALGYVDQSVIVGALLRADVALFTNRAEGRLSLPA